MSEARGSGLTLSGLGLAAGQLAKIADAVGLPIGDAPDSATILLVDMSKHTLREAMARRPAACIEWNGTGTTALGKVIALLPPTHPTRALALSVTTVTASRHAVARLFKDTLARVLPPSITADDVAEFCITELVTNAIIHGNLEIANGGYSDADGLGDFASYVEARLENSQFAGRRLTISASWENGSLTVAVADEGEGFVLDEQPGEVSTDVGTGRGLGLIRSLGVSLRSEDEGRRICLVFP